MKKAILMISLLVSALLGGVSGYAQSGIMVMGKVTGRTDGGPLAGTRIFIFKTVGEGVYEYERAMGMYESDYVPEGACRDAISQRDGEYELTVPSGGSLLFYKAPFKPVLVHVKGRNRHNVVIEDTRMITEVTVEAEGRKTTRKGKVVGFGNKFSVKDFPYFLKKEMMGEVEGVGKTNARLVTQMFLTTADSQDTLRYFPPRVYDGAQFHRTQYLWSNDLFYGIADTLPRLTSETDSVMFNVQFKVDRPEELYFCKAHVWIEDYIKTYYRDTIELLNTGRVSRPFQFLEYSFERGRLDSQEYYKPPRRELVLTPKDMSIKFRIGSSEIDLSDPQTKYSLNALKEEISAVCRDSASALKEIHFKGYASPDGVYEKNIDLSRRRTMVVMEEVLSAIPDDRLLRVYHTSSGEVSSWLEVASMLEENSFSDEAAQIRAAVAKYPRDIDAQGREIRNMKQYRRVVAPLLPSLRHVRCEYLTEVFRYLTPEEILSRYNTDADYRNGKKLLTLNEYWHLFNLVSDEKQLESLYQRALDASFKAEREYWALPANHLASLYIGRKQADTTLLAPFINEKRPLNYSQMDMETGQRRIINPEGIIINQVQMYLLSKNYVRAEELSSMLERSQPMLRAIVRCLGGYLDPDDPADRVLVEQIRESSPRNKVIINLFSEQFDSTTVAALNKLPSDEALTFYLKAQRLCLQHSNQVYLMKAADFDREEDPYLRLPDDKEIPAATQEDIDALIKKIDETVLEMEMFRAMGLEDEVSLMEKEVGQLRVMVEAMQNKEPVIERVECKAYDAAYIYLQECFARDKRFILTAKADADINEDLLNDVLGIKQTVK